MNTNERRNWMLRHEELWADTDALRAKMIEENALHPNLSNWKFVLERLIEYCQRVKRRANLGKNTPLKPLTNLVMTEENFDELILLREVIDILCQQKHPVVSMDESGYTYYDYAVYKRKQHNRAPIHVLKEINIFFSGGDIDYIYEGRKITFGGRFN